MWKICNKICNEEKLPKNKWTEEIVVPIVKKRQNKMAENYRRVTVTQTTYKIYKSILAERLKEEVEVA